MEIVSTSVTDASILQLTLEPAVSLYSAFGFRIVFQQGLYIQMEKKL